MSSAPEAFAVALPGIARMLEKRDNVIKGYGGWPIE